jgi:hypothetical protein
MGAGLAGVALITYNRRWLLLSSRRDCAMKKLAWRVDNLVLNFF